MVAIVREQDHVRVKFIGTRRQFFTLKNLNSNKEIREGWEERTP